MKGKATDTSKGPLSHILVDVSSPMSLLSQHDMQVYPIRKSLLLIRLYSFQWNPVGTEQRVVLYHIPQTFLIYTHKGI